MNFSHIACFLGGFTVAWAMSFLIWYRPSKSSNSAAFWENLANQYESLCKDLIEFSRQQNEDMRQLGTKIKELDKQASDLRGFINKDSTDCWRHGGEQP